MLPGPPPPNPTPPSAGKFRLWMVAGLVVLVAGFAASTQIDTLQADETAATTDDQKTTTSDGDGTTRTSDPTEDEGQDSTTTTSSSTSSSSGGEGLDPLPGDDWGPAAREQFVADCVAEPLMSAGIGLGATPEDTCGCLYEHVADSGMSLDEFNEGWTDPNFEARPFDDPVKQLFLDAIASCTLS